MSKRAASSELNHDNWDDEDEPEEQPTDFKQASAEVMAKRVIKTGKRRLGGAAPPTASPFAKFSFGASVGNTNTTSSGTGTPGSTSGSGSSGFSFVASTNGMPERENKDDPSKPEYLGKLKGLNEELIAWLQKCMEKNPCCIFTPVFEDYDAYVKKIKAERDSKVEETATASSGNSPGTNSATASSTAPSPFAGFKFTNSPAPATTATPSFSFLTSSLTTSPNTSSSGDKPKPLGSIFGNLPLKSSDAPAPFSLGSSKPFSFGSAVTAPPPSDSTEGGDSKAEEDEEPPKNEFKPVTEDDAIFSQRTKVFVLNDGKYSDRGVGMLYIKEVNAKYQVIVRADTSLGNLLLNIVLNETMPITRRDANHVMLVCVPLPEKGAKPVPTLLKVKTKEDGDKLYAELEKYKKTAK